MPTPLSDPTLKSVHDRLIAILQGKPEQRTALAQHCGVSIGTINNWLATRPIPDRKIPLLHSFIAAHGSRSTTTLHVPFTLDEYAMIQEAARRGRYDDIEDFGRSAIKEKARALMSDATARTSDGPLQDELAMVAEIPPRPKVKKLAS